MYTNVSDEFKNIVKSNAIIGTARLTIVETNTILDSDVLVDLTITDNCYNNGQLIGTAMSKELEANLINKNNYDLADKELKCEIGVVLSDGTKEFVPYGNYIVKSYEDLKSNNQYKLIAYDYMDKLNIKYEPMTNITYPTTLKNFYYKLCTNYGISYETQTLPNESFKVNEAPNFDGMTARSVLMKCAELFGRFAKINRNNKMQMFLKNTTTEKIDGYSMNSKLTMNNKYGPVNVVSLELGNVEGENVTKQDDTSIKANGETIIRIADNPFAYSEDLREKAITDLFNALNGFTYVPVEFKYKSRMYLDNGDTFQVENVQDGSILDSIVLNQVIKIPSVRSGEIKSEALTSTAIKQKYISQSKQANTRTEIIVDKQNQKIESVVNNVTKQNNKISQITQTVDEINSKISDIADITTYGESDRAEVELTDVNESEPIMIKVHPTSTNISYLYPRENLYPSDLQYLPDRIIRFTRAYEEDGQTLTENIDYLLPDDLLKYSDTVYDEFYLNYESQTCQVIKRCAYNADGTVRALGTEITTDYPYPTIILGEGNYTITLPGYDYGYLYARLMAKNIYTTQFYTKVETDSRINQKANEINLGVSQTLTNYSTTNEMNSAITLKANEISSTVSKKVGEDEIISKINQSAEKIAIEANKISLTGKTLNLADDMAIVSNNFNVDSDGNMTCASANITNGTIKSQNFNVDSSGNMTCSNANITGGKINVTGAGSTTDLVSVTNFSNSSQFSYLQPIGAGFVNGKNRVDIFTEGQYSWGGTMCDVTVNDDGGYTDISGDGITTPNVTQTSLESQKKNFEKYTNALETLKDIDIYKYNLKSESDNTKKHIGFVIGDNYKYSEEVTSRENDGADIYSFVSLCCQAIKEQQEEIEQMKKEIEKLKGGK